MADRCPVCGRQLQAAMKFCPYCGVPAQGVHFGGTHSDEPPPAYGHGAGPQPMPGVMMPMYYAPPVNYKRGLAIAGGIIMLIDGILAAIFGILMMFFDDLVGFFLYGTFLLLCFAFSIVGSVAAFRSWRVYFALVGPALLITAGIIAMFAWWFIFFFVGIIGTILGVLSIVFIGVAWSDLRERERLKDLPYPVPQGLPVPMMQPPQYGGGPHGPF